MCVCVQYETLLLMPFLIANLLNMSVTQYSSECPIIPWSAVVISGSTTKATTQSSLQVLMVSIFPAEKITVVNVYGSTKD